MGGSWFLPVCALKFKFYLKLKMWTQKDIFSRNILIQGKIWSMLRDYKWFFLSLNLPRRSYWWHPRSLRWKPLSAKSTHYPISIRALNFCPIRHLFTWPGAITYDFETNPVWPDLAKFLHVWQNLWKSWAIFKIYLGSIS